MSVQNEAAQAAVQTSVTSATPETPATPATPVVTADGVSTYAEANAKLGYATLSGEEYAELRDWKALLVPNKPEDEADYVTLPTVIKGKVKTAKTIGRGDAKEQRVDEEGNPIFYNKTTPFGMNVRFSSGDLSKLLSDKGAQICAGVLAMPLYSAAYKKGNPMPAGMEITPYDLRQYYGMDDLSEILEFLLTKAFAPTNSKVSQSAAIAAACAIDDTIEVPTLFKTFAAKFATLDAKAYNGLAKKSDWNKLAKFVERGCTPRGKTYPDISVIKLGIEIIKMQMDAAETAIAMTDGKLSQLPEDAQPELRATLAAYRAKLDEYKFLSCALDASRLSAEDAARKALANARKEQKAHVAEDQADDGVIELL